MRHPRDGRIVLMLFLGDLLCLNLLAAAAIYLRFESELFWYPGAQPPWHSVLGFLGLTHLTLFPSLAVSGAYRVPKRWKGNEALPAVTEALLLAVPLAVTLLFLLRLGAVQKGLVLTPSRFFAVFLWTGLLVGLAGVRWMAGRILAALYRKGLWLRRAFIVGEGPGARRLRELIVENPWLGEVVVGTVDGAGEGGGTGGAEDLAAALAREGADVVWLAQRGEVDPSLPWLLFSEEGASFTWRALPQDFEWYEGAILERLTDEERELFYSRVTRDVALSPFGVAMIGSRGVPANYGGVERYVEEVGAHIAAKGVQVAVYCHRRYVTARGAFRGMELRFVPAIRTKHLETISNTFLATLHALLKEEEIIHYHAMGPSTLAWIPRIFGRKVVVTVQGLDWQRSKWGPIARRYLKFGEWTSARVPHRTIVVSRSLEQHYRRRYPKEVVYIPNGFDPPDRKAPERIKEWGLEKDGYLLFVGRLVPEKGCHLLLEAFARVRTQKRLVIAGRASHERRYQMELMERARGLEGVRFVGFAAKELLRELYSNAYLVVHPSEMEGLSIALLEALSYGNCLLVSDTPENQEALGGLGFTFRANDPVDLALQMQRLLDSPQEVQEMRDRVLSHWSASKDWQGVSEETMRVYQSLVKR